MYRAARNQQRAADALHYSPSIQELRAGESNGLQSRSRQGATLTISANHSHARYTASALDWIFRPSQGRSRPRVVLERARCAANRPRPSRRGRKPVADANQREAQEGKDGDQDSGNLEEPREETKVRQAVHLLVVRHVGLHRVHERLVIGQSGTHLGEDRDQLRETRQQLSESGKLSTEVLLEFVGGERCSPVARPFNNAVSSPAAACRRSPLASV